MGQQVNEVRILNTPALSIMTLLQYLLQTIAQDYILLLKLKS